MPQICPGPLRLCQAPRVSSVCWRLEALHLTAASQIVSPEKGELRGMLKQKGSKEIKEIKANLPLATVVGTFTTIHQSKIARLFAYINDDVAKQRHLKISQPFQILFSLYLGVCKSH